MSRTYATPAAILVVSALFPALGTLAVTLRLFAKKRTRSMLWIDDWLTIPALLLEYILSALSIWGATTGFLEDVLPKTTEPSRVADLDVNSHRQIRLLQIQYFTDIAAILALGFIKLSILYFYRSIFCSRLTTRTAFHTATTFLIALVIVWTLVFGFGAIFLCGAHPERAWSTVAIVVEKYSLRLPLLEGNAISDFSTDVIIRLLPVWSLNMSIHRKLVLILVFLVGLLAIGASAVRMAIYLDLVSNAFEVADSETLVIKLVSWTIAECGLGVIVVCLPTLRPVYSKTCITSLVSIKARRHSRFESTSLDVIRVDSCKDDLLH
ncbi:hypothetical protein BDW74DRAFT_175337 [Aspergillus multicolor]|uniref:uncharacterized protein n=1 Tax=Aspergillus multicolor TaxID=41759 RepID=UPI003CCCB309